MAVTLSACDCLFEAAAGNKILSSQITDDDPRICLLHTKHLGIFCQSLAPPTSSPKARPPAPDPWHQSPSLHPQLTSSIDTPTTSKTFTACQQVSLSSSTFTLTWCLLRKFSIFQSTFIFNVDKCMVILKRSLMSQGCYWKTCNGQQEFGAWKASENRHHMIPFPHSSSYWQWLVLKYLRRAE